MKNLIRKPLQKYNGENNDLIHLVVYFNDN